MPQAFVALFAYIGVDAAIVGVLGITYAGLAVSITYALAALATNYALGALSRLLSGSDHVASTQTGQQITLRDTVSAGVIAYGQYRTSGHEVYEYTKSS